MANIKLKAIRLLNKLIKATQLERLNSERLVKYKEVYNYREL